MAVGKKNLKALVVVFGCLMVSSALMVSAEWKMKWNDEFEGSQLDSSKWDMEVNCWGGGNGEKQCYTARSTNVYVSNGALNLRPVQGTYQGSNSGCTLNNENSCTWTQPATSGRVRTLKALDGSWKYGRFEIRAKLPKGNWLWPAIWMLPTDTVYGTWAASGEIDIMEARGQVPNEVSSALHFGGTWPNNRFTTSGDIAFPGVDFTADFHVFALEWDSSALKFFVDDRLTWTQSLQKSYGSNYNHNGAPFDEKFHILLNVAVAGGFFDPNRFGSFDIATAGPTWTQPMQIDYVRVYEWNDSTDTPVPIAPAPTAPAVPISPPTTTSPSSPSPSASSDTCELQMPVFPVADAHTDSMRADMNFGRDLTLNIFRPSSSSSTHTRTAYLKFYLPKGVSPKKAMLSMWGGLDEASGSSNAIVSGPLNNDWAQDQITSNLRPPICPLCSTISQTITPNAMWTTWDVLSMVNKAIESGSNVISFSVSLSSPGHASFNSAEAPTNRPVLSLAY